MPSQEPMMKVQPIRRHLASVSAEILAIGLFDGDAGLPIGLEGLSIRETLGRLIDAKDLSRSVGDVVPLLGLKDSGLAASSVVMFGLGSREKFDNGAAFSAGVALGKKLAARPRDHVAVAVPDSCDPAAIVEGVIVGTRASDLRKSEPSRHPFGTLTIVGPADAPDSFDDAVLRGEVVGQAVNLARDLANTPPAEKNPTHLAAMAREAAESAGLTVVVWDESKIREERFGGLIGVAAGSDQPPAFVILEHRKGGDSPTLAMVGKGVTFDSGGLSLKPSASMEDMKCDMTGAAVVLATMTAIARLGIEANVVGYLAMTENMINGRSMKLGDVLTMRNGKTVEILNTDAEGRLILADALSYAAEQEPSGILDLATLTGACIVALGTKVAGLFANNDAFASDVIRASGQTGERVWRLPLDDDYRELIKSHVADLKNVGGKWAGAISAAKFLEEFVDGRPWVHLDIAGPSWAESESSSRDAGGTGCFVRTLVALIEGSARSTA
jgi:leucyl aminopeptidase